jgi:hypothetical protein
MAEQAGAMADAMVDPAAMHSICGIAAAYEAPARQAELLARIECPLGSGCPE